MFFCFVFYEDQKFFIIGSIIYSHLAAMPQSHNRNPSPVPDVNWDSGLKEMNETWKGALACIGVAFFFIMTIGIIYWQVVDQPNKNWILKGTFSGLIWERNTHSLILQTLSENKTYVEIDVEPFPDMEQPFVKNLCWLNKTEFCYTWGSTTDLKISLQPSFSAGTECYSIRWTPIHCEVKHRDCFSMTNISWYGGASLSAQHWPINNVNMALQPFVISNLKYSPKRFGSVLERYFLGSTGVSILIDPDIPVSISIERNKFICVETPSSIEMTPLQYTVCIGQTIQTVHEEIGSQLYGKQRRLPNIDILGMPLWRHYGVSDSAAKLERELRSFHNKLKRHGFGEGLIAVNEHSTILLSTKDQMPIMSQRVGTQRYRRAAHLKNLKLIITTSPYTSINSEQFQLYLRGGKENYWISLHSKSEGSLAPILTKWKGQFSVRLNITNDAAVNWYLNSLSSLKNKLGAEYIMFEGLEGNTFVEQSFRTTKCLEGENYTGFLAALAVKLGNSTIITASTRSNYLPIFVQMSPLHSDWSYSGLKGIVPSVLHYSLLGYNFFIPDAVGGTFADEFLTDEELFIRWLQIVTFLPVMTFNTPPWVCCDDLVLNLTRLYIKKHQDTVVPLLTKYTEQWLNVGNPIYRPMWWISPNDPMAFTVDDQFLIGDEMLVAPITEQGQVHRDIFLPGVGYKWMDTKTTEVFDGGTVLKRYHCSLLEIPVFIKKAS
ncbi:SITS-binding protein-like [Bombina bombina]|uniref:SITS-binding protein-like n=1 Tax=Bombina bombina TaxID=8345 RepID=UPI00235A689B|nr:SITS-binding protein-like [Bombina bombina]